ncbi:hypothetical protein D3C71_1807530 [compost metagenome]
MHQQNDHHAGDGDIDHTDGRHHEHGGHRSHATAHQPQHQELHPLRQPGTQHAGPITTRHGLGDLAQWQHQPAGKRQYQLTERIVERDTLVLHVPAQQAGARQQPSDNIEQQRQDL